MCQYWGSGRVKVVTWGGILSTSIIMKRESGSVEVSECQSVRDVVLTWAGKLGASTCQACGCVRLAVLRRRSGRRRSELGSLRNSGVFSSTSTSASQSLMPLYV